MSTAPLDITPPVPRHEEEPTSRSDLYINYYDKKSHKPSRQSLTPWFCVIGRYPPHIFQLRNWLRDPLFVKQLTTDMKTFVSLKICGSFTDLAATLHVAVLWKTTELEIDKQQNSKDCDVLKDAIQALFEKYNRKFKPKRSKIWSARPPLTPHRIQILRGHQQDWFTKILDEIRMEENSLSLCTNTIH